MFTRAPDCPMARRSISLSVWLTMSPPTAPYDLLMRGLPACAKPSRAANVFDPGIGTASKPSMPAIFKAVLASSVS